MTFSYFRSQICEELEGACDYIKQALEIKVENPSWAKQFVDASAVELTHATMLFKMFEEHYTNITKTFTDDQKAAMPWLSEVRTEIVDLYAEKYAKVKSMHELFNK